jgi:hypothetical protein
MRFEIAMIGGERITRGERGEKIGDEVDQHRRRFESAAPADR